MSGHSSSSTFHDFKILTFAIIKNPEFKHSKIQQNGHTQVPIFSLFVDSYIFMEMRSHIFPGCPQIFLIFQVFWYNKMKKYVVPGPPKPRNHQITEIIKITTLYVCFLISICCYGTSQARMLCLIPEHAKHYKATAFFICVAHPAVAIRTPTAWQLVGS